jgi:hypothetical protein
MKHKCSRASQQRWLALAWFLIAVCGLNAQVVEVAEKGAELKFEIQLIWATNDRKSPNPKHKEVEPEIRKKLGELPLKWNSYFEVNRKQLVVSHGGKGKVALSEKCSIEVKDADGKKVEVSLFGKKGDAVLSRTQPLPKGEILVLGGNAPDRTAWLVTLKRIE